MNADALMAALTAARGEGERLAILAAQVVELTREVDTQRADLDTLTANASESRVDRTRYRDQLTSLADMMLALGERVGKVERGLSSISRLYEQQEEMARLRHNEVLHALGIAARDSAAKGTTLAVTSDTLATTTDRVAATESGLVRVTRMVGISGTVVAVVHLVLNFIAQNIVWRVDRHATRSPSPPVLAASAPAASGPRPPVPGDPGAGEPDPHP